MFRFMPITPPLTLDALAPGSASPPFILGLELIQVMDAQSYEQNHEHYAPRATEERPIGCRVSPPLFITSHPPFMGIWRLRPEVS